MPGARALQWSAPKGRPLPRGGLFPRRCGAASGRGRGPVKAFRGQRMPPSVKSVFCAWALGRTAGCGFSTKKALPRLRHPTGCNIVVLNRLPTGDTGRRVLSLFAAMPCGAGGRGLRSRSCALCLQRNVPFARRRNDKVYRSGDKPENVGGFFR